MTRQRCLIGVGVLCSLALAFLLFRGPEPVRAAPAEDSQFEDRAAVKVAMKNQIIEYMTWPKVKRIGGRAFVVGYRVSAPGSVWLPIDEVSFIEQYASLDDMVKVYPGLAPKKEEPAKPADAVKVTPVIEPKKN